MPHAGDTRVKESAQRPCLMYVLGLAPQKIGGVEKFLREFVRALDARGWDAVLCFDGPISPVFREYLEGPSVTIESLDGQGHLGLSCAGPLWALLRKHRPRAFVYAFHGVMRSFPWMAKMAGAERIFFNDHSSRPSAQAVKRLAWHKRLVGHFLTAPLTAIVSVAEFTRRTGDALGLTSAPNIVVSNGVEVYPSAPERGQEFRERFGILTEELVITQVCWMVEVKGVDVMLQAAALLLAKHTGIRLLLVGDGPEIGAYRELARILGIEDRVLFTGLLGNPTESGLFEASDIYCQPSVWQEACPLAVLEAMSSKLPVVASNTGGLPEIVQDGATGMLVPVRGVEEIYRALEQMVADPELRRRMGEAGYEAVLRRYRIEGTAERYVELFVGEATASAER